MKKFQNNDPTMIRSDGVLKEGFKWLLLAFADPKQISVHIPPRKGGRCPSLCIALKRLQTLTYFPVCSTYLYCWLAVYCDVDKELLDCMYFSDEIDEVCCPLSTVKNIHGVPPSLW